MNRRPTIVTSRRRQCELLRSWSDWALTSILLDPTGVGRTGEAGWSGTRHRDAATGERLVGTPDGLGFGADESWRNPHEVIPWPEVEAIAREIPPSVHEELVTFHGRWRAHQSAYPRFTATAEASGCGPIIPGEPLTPRQEAYLRERAAFEESGRLAAWERHRSVLEGERLELHGRALAGDAGEAVDLLELLEEERPENPVDAGSDEHRRQPQQGMAVRDNPGRPGLLPEPPRSRDEREPRAATPSMGRSAVGR